MTNAEFFAGFSPEWFIVKAAKFVEPRRLYEPVPAKEFHGPFKIRNRDCYWAMYDRMPCFQCMECQKEFYD